MFAEYAEKQRAGLNPEPFVLRKSGQSFANVSALDLPKLIGDQDHIVQNLQSYIQGFSPAVRDIFERFGFATQVDRLAKNKLLYLVTEHFTRIDLHPSKVDNAQVGVVFEELIRKFAELSNEMAGEHFTPRELIRLMVDLIFVEDSEVRTRPGVVRTIYDPAVDFHWELTRAARVFPLRTDPCANLSPLAYPGGDGVIDMELWSVIRRWLMEIISRSGRYRGVLGCRGTPSAVSALWQRGVKVQHP